MNNKATGRIAPVRNSISTVRPSICVQQPVNILPSPQGRWNLEQAVVLPAPRCYLWVGNAPQYLKHDRSTVSIFTLVDQRRKSCESRPTKLLIRSLLRPGGVLRAATSRTARPRIGAFAKCEQSGSSRIYLTDRVRLSADRSRFDDRTSDGRTPPVERS